jgi:hypothetical protein
MFAFAKSETARNEYFSCARAGSRMRDGFWGSQHLSYLSLSACAASAKLESKASKQRQLSFASPVEYDTCSNVHPHLTARTFDV